MGAYADYNRSLRDAEKRLEEIRNIPGHDAEDEVWLISRIADLKSCLLEMADTDGLDDPYEAFDSDGSEEYRGYWFEYDFYGRGEFTVQYCGDDIVFHSIERARQWVDELIAREQVR